MPTGKFHEETRVTFTIPVLSVTLVIIIPLAIWFDSDYPLVTGLSVWFHWFCTKWIGPDLDQVSRTKDETRMLESFGPILGRVFVTYWTAYAGVMNVMAQALNIAHPLYGVHRTWLTHSIVPGTLIRMFVFNLPVIIMWWSFFNLYIEQIPYILCVLLGQFIAFATGDGIHLYLDNNFYVEKGKLKRLRK